MANHKEIVERVKAEAKDNDDLPTRTEVLREIKRTEIKDKALKREHEIILRDIYSIHNHYKSVDDRVSVDFARKKTRLTVLFRYRQVAYNHIR